MASGPAPGDAEKPLASVLRGGALDAYEKGRLLFEAGDAATAHIKFLESFELSHNPRLLYNMAACSKTERRYALAIRELRRFMALGTGWATEEQLGRAKELLATMQSLVSPVRVTLTPAAAALVVDGEPQNLDGGEAVVLLDIGKHELRAELPGFNTSSSTLDITDTKEKTLSIKLTEVLPDTKLVVTVASDAVVELDKKGVSVGPWEGLVTPGLHHVRVWANNYKAYEVDVLLALGDSKRLAVALVKEEKKGAWVPWALGGLGAALGAGVGGYYLFKPATPAPVFTEGSAATIQLH